MSAANKRRTKFKTLSQREITEAFDAHWERNGKRRQKRKATTPGASAARGRRRLSKGSTTEA